MTVEAKIDKFAPGNNPQEHISSHESEWKRIRYIDEIV